MRRTLLFLLFIGLSMQLPAMAAQTNNSERKMSPMLAQKLGAYKRDVALGIAQTSVFKQRYGSKFFPADNKGRMFLCVTITSGIDAIADSIVSWGGKIHNKGKFRLFAWIPMDKLSDLSSMKGVMFVDSPGYAVAEKDDVVSVGESNSSALITVARRF